MASQAGLEALKRAPSRSAVTKVKRKEQTWAAFSCYIHNRLGMKHGIRLKRASCAVLGRPHLDRESRRPIRVIRVVGSVHQTSDPPVTNVGEIIQYRRKPAVSVISHR